MAKGERYLKLENIKEIAREKDIEVEIYLLPNPAVPPSVFTNLSLTVLFFLCRMRIKTKIWFVCGLTSTLALMATCRRISLKT